MKPGFAPLNQATSQLLTAIFEGQVEGVGDAAALAPPFAEWLATSKRFVVFAEQNLAKIRKKVRVIRNDDERDDLACELRTAYLLLQEPKFALEYEPLVVEAGGKARGRSADFAVTFRTHIPFHVEVTRLRAPQRAAPLSPDAMAYVESQRLANVVCEKLGQLSAATPNVLWVWGATSALLDLAVEEVMTSLKRRAEQSEADFFARYGFAKRADFIRHLQRLNGIILQGLDEQIADGEVRWWANNDTRHALPGAVAHRLRGLAHAG